MSSMRQAGEKRRRNTCDDGDSHVPVKIEALCPPTSSSSSTASPNSLSVPAAKTDDVTALHTAAEMEELLAQKAQQVRAPCAVECKAKIRKLESNYATEKAQLLAEVAQNNQRHADKTARLNAKIEPLEARLRATLEAHAVTANVKKEIIVDEYEQTNRQEMEQGFAEERRRMEQRFAEAKHYFERRAAEAQQKMDQEIASMNEQLASKNEAIATLTNIVAELTTKANRAERETMDARQLSWQYYAQVEALQQEILALRAASHVFAAPHAPTTTMVTPSSNQIYVAKLTPAMAEDVLRQYFSQFGNVMQ
ncbi:hypothetical protein AAVH_39756, partial [Aphelenchoides avenae]